MKKKHIIILVVFIVIFGTIIGIKAYLKTNLEQLTVSNLDLSKLEDGNYTGSYKAFPVAAEVTATVENHKITKIDLVKHVTGQGTQAEIIPERVVETQSLEVDIVSGATYSSKVILKAIEDALNNANK